MGSGRRAPPGWPRFRRRLLDLAGWRCADCGKPGKLEISHLLPVWKYPHLEMDPDNCRVRCRGCHLAADRKPVSADRAAWIAYVRM